MSYAFCVTTWGRGSFLIKTLSHIPAEARVLLVDTKEQQWSLARGWNYGIDRLLAEGYECVIVMNDDVVLRPDTPDLLSWGLLRGQFGDDRYPSEWGPARPELLLLSGRHASYRDDRTAVVDWSLLNSKEPAWVPGPDFSTFAVSRRLFEVVGKFDEEFPVFAEDNDMHRRIQLAGYEAGAFAPYWHFMNGTTRMDPERQHAVTTRLFEQSKSHYKAKWGGWLGEEQYSVPFNGAKVESL